MNMNINSINAIASKLAIALILFLMPVSLFFSLAEGITVEKNISEAQLKAFPSAYGAGAYASGGRGGNVYHVTRLDDAFTGPQGAQVPAIGTFRWAVTQPRPATVVFDVSGTVV